MKTLLTILVISFSLILNSCSNKDDSSESLGYAPETLIGKSLNLSLGPNSIAWALSFFSNGVISMIPSDTSWKIEDTYYIYRKTSENRAELTIEYTIRIIDKMVAHCYEVELLFTSESEGTYKGYDEWESDGKEDSNSLNGNFVVGTGGTQNPEDIMSDESEELYVYLGSANIFPNRASLSISYTNPDKYQTADSYLTAGICYGKSPHPTISDKTTSQKMIDTYYRTVNLSELEPGTVYYLRPYTMNNNKVTYYKETSIETVGKNIKLNLERLNGNTIRLSYSINKSSTYNVTLNVVKMVTPDAIEAAYQLKDFGYKRKGECETATYTYSGSWGQYAYFSLPAIEQKENITIFYRSKFLYSDGFHG